ncbi:phage tail tube protein [Saccharopolyspora pogona]|uniref:phage tail tube protein n=1 Tax=Saccharopolyspora pogona TaxID=333966 RepID=UPI001688821D|nr:phage tail protein [Saccharopolyspora pogona]
MALNANAVVTAAVGYIYTAPVGTEAPTLTEVQNFDPAVGITGWDNIGHTSRDELPVFGYEGGDTEVRGSWQAAVLKEVVTDPASDYVTFNVLQFDETALGLYYGSANANSTAGVFSVSGTATTGTTEKAVLIIIVDGSHKIGFHAEKASIRREDSIDLAIDEFAAMPLRATLVLNDGASYLFSWIGIVDTTTP